MKNFILILSAFIMIASVSCTKEEITAEVEATDNFESTAKIPWYLVNPNANEYIVYQASAFCGNGLNQVQIWADDPITCDCLLDHFIETCTEQITNVLECTQRYSYYPPVDFECSY